MELRNARTASRALSAAHFGTAEVLLAQPAVSARVGNGAADLADSAMALVLDVIDEDLAEQDSTAARIFFGIDKDAAAMNFASRYAEMGLRVGRSADYWGRREFQLPLTRDIARHILIRNAAVPAPPTEGRFSRELIDRVMYTGRRKGLRQFLGGLIDPWKSGRFDGGEQFYLRSLWGAAQFTHNYFTFTGPMKQLLGDDYLYLTEML